MFEQYENKEFPCPSRESKKRIGEPGHDSDSSWDSFCRAYCGPGAARLVKLYPDPEGSDLTATVNCHSIGSTS